MSRWWERADVRQPPPRTAGRRLSASEQRWCVVAHLSPLPVVGLGMAVLGRPMVWLAVVLPLGPLLLFAVTRGTSSRVRAHATEALNFNITIALATLMTGVGLTLVGRTPSTMLLLPLLLLVLLLLAANWLVLLVIGAIEAGRGVTFRYPAIVRIVPAPPAGGS